MMNRRGFLGAMAAAVAGATLDPERALWVLGARTISIPAPRNVFITPEEYARFVLLTLNNRIMVDLANRGHYEPCVSRTAAWKLGDTIAIRKPLMFLGRA